MPARKKKTTKSSTKKPVIKPVITSSQGPTYDTLMIITILLLLFVYPLGLIFMWAWMRTWPVWLKIVISLPFLISLFFIFLAFYLVGHAIRHSGYRSMIEQKRYQQMQQQNMMHLSPTPTYTTY